MIPKSLDLVSDPTVDDTKHHLIRLRNRMSLDAYRGALDNLARNAIVRANEKGLALIHYV